MQKISELWEEFILNIGSSPKFKWNEAELTQVKLSFSSWIRWVIENKDLLLRKCLIWNNSEHNREIIEIYDRLNSINQNYQIQNLPYNLNIVPHFVDDEWNIYITDLSTSLEWIWVYDLMPDWYYIDPNKKDKSKFKNFKDLVKQLDTNKTFIISKVFEQLAILHANNFIVWDLKFEDKYINHPTLSLFLYRFEKIKNWNNQDIFIHDIHNLELLNHPTTFDYINHIVNDLKNMAFDIIRFFKWIWIPNWWFKIYWETLKKLNPELYKIIYSAFLRNPLIEIDMHSIIDSNDESKKIQKTATKVATHIEKKELIKEQKSVLSIDNIFYLKFNKDKINKFFQEMTPENTQIIFDFDWTITYSWENILNIALNEDLTLKDFNDIDLSNINIRKWFITFLKLLLSKWYNVKIYSLWFKEIIKKILLNNWIDFDESNIFSNSIYSQIKFDKTEIELPLDKNKNKLVFWDNLVDFSFTQSSDLKFGFLNNSSKKHHKNLDFNANTDLYFIENNANFIDLYYFFR